MACAQLTAILFHSYCMAPKQKSTLLSTVVDKGRRAFSYRSKQSGDFNSAKNPLSTSPSAGSQKRFKKSNDARRDMSILAMTYILQENPTIRELILLIIGLNDHDDSGKVRRTCNSWYSPQAKDDILSSLKSLPFPSHLQSNSHPSLRKIRPKH